MKFLLLNLIIIGIGFISISESAVIPQVGCVGRDGGSGNYSVSWSYTSTEIETIEKGPLNFLSITSIPFSSPTESLSLSGGTYVYDDSLGGLNFYNYDVNNDGALDIVTSCHSGDDESLCWIETTSSGVVEHIIETQPVNIAIPGIGPQPYGGYHSIFVGDFNSDGLTDVVATTRIFEAFNSEYIVHPVLYEAVDSDATSWNITQLSNQVEPDLSQTVRFTYPMPTVTVNSPNIYAGLAVGDLDADGAIDVGIANKISVVPSLTTPNPPEFQGHFVTYNGTDGFTFRAPVGQEHRRITNGNALSLNTAAWIFFEDFDKTRPGDEILTIYRDGDDDFYISDTDNGSATNAAQRYTFSGRSSGAASDVRHATIGSYSASGALDIIYSLDSSPNGLYIIPYNETGFVSGTAVTIEGSDFVTSFQLVDLDKDGTAEILCTSGTSIFYFTHTAGTSFTKTVVVTGLSGGSEIAAIAVLDVDYDGDRDIIAVTTGGDLRWYSSELAEPTLVPSTSFESGSISPAFNTTTPVASPDITWFVYDSTTAMFDSVSANGVSVTPISCCANGYTDFEEECDDGNLNLESCPYGVMGEQCQVCSPLCTLSTQDAPYCGDGMIDIPNEDCDSDDDIECDYGINLESCTVCNGATCTEVAGNPHYCGDGVVDSVLGSETCDDGNRVTETCPDYDTPCTVCGDTCTSTPGVLLECGDGIVTSPEEECDDGIQADLDMGCTSCVLPRCGNNITESFGSYQETCDDGNTVTEDCTYGVRSCVVCTANCLEGPGNTAFCGDGIVNGDEACDGGESGNDECTIACTTIETVPDQLSLDAIVDIINNLSVYELGGIGGGLFMLCCLCFCLRGKKSDKVLAASVKDSTGAAQAANFGVVPAGSPATPVFTPPEKL